jgi:molecular chaperone DnaK (HSP70)
VVRRAVVTIPAGATPTYLDSLALAARLAHLEIVQVAAEPVAGVLALGLHGRPIKQRLVVCDFGGGTFDVSCVAQDGLRFEPVATYGDTALGGDDLDLALAEAIAGIIYQRARFDVLNDHVRRGQLIRRCEGVKRQLSTAPHATLSMRDAYVEHGEFRKLDVVVERSWIEPRWAPLIERALTKIATALARAGWRTDQVDRVALIGGSSLVPAFRNAIAHAFGADKILAEPIAMVAVAMGATLLTARHIGAGMVPVLPAGTMPVLAQADDGIPIDIG